MGLVQYFTQIKVLSFKSKNQFSEPCTASYAAAQLIISRLYVHISANLWDRAHIRLKIVFIHKNVQDGTGPILLNKMGPVP